MTVCSRERSDGGIVGNARSPIHLSANRCGCWPDKFPGHPPKPADPYLRQRTRGAPDDRDAMFAPFQRLGDSPVGAGVGLGLAVAHGLAKAVDASINVDDTPGGDSP